MTGTAAAYEDGDIVWVKLSNCWWPGEVHCDERLPSDIVGSFKNKRPIAIVKFFQEDAYEYVKNPNNIYAYHCPRRLDFIRKGLDMYQANHKYMEMFPADVATAERRTKGDPDIINDPSVLNPVKTVSVSKRWSETMADTSAKKKTASPGLATAVNKKTVINQKGTPNKPAAATSSPSTASAQVVTLPTAGHRPNKEHEVRILSSATNRTPTLGGGGHVAGGGGTGSGFGSGLNSSSAQQMYKCHLCNFSSGRMNLLILHSKSHSSSTSDGNVDSRRSSLTNRSTSSMLLTPTKRFSTTSSCTSTSSPALSPVSSPPRTASVSSEKKPPVAAPAAVVVVVNKSRPPKKRTKRMSTSTEEPAQPVPAMPAAAESKAPTNHSSNATHPGHISARRNRNRRRSSTPTTTVAEQVPSKEKSPDRPVTPATPVKVKSTQLEKSILMDWSDDEEGEEEVKAGTTQVRDGSPLKTPPASAIVSPTGRSSPVRCRNIPKKDRREIVIEEFGPKISPNRTDEVQSTVEPPAADAEVNVEDAVPEPIVQKKKKAAIERLSQQSQEETAVVNVAEAKPVTQTKKDVDQVVQTVSTVEQNNNRSRNTNATVSCFDFEEDVNPVATNNGGSVLVEEKKLNQVKDEVEKRDEELLAEIGDILKSTTEIVKVATNTTGKEAALVVSPLRTNRSDITLPPKERGKRIFKSRNMAAVKDEGEIPVQVKSPEKAKVAEIDLVKSEEVSPENKPPLVPRKRKFDNTEVEVKSSPVPILVEEEVEDEVPLAKVRKVSTPELATEENCDEPSEAEVRLQADVPVVMEVDEDAPVSEEDAVATPKINNSHPEEEPVNSPVHNGDGESDSSPAKTNDLLATKAVQKVQLVQRIRAQDGSETTETKVAKISAADNGSVLTVAISQSGALTATQPLEDTQSPITVETDGEEKMNSNELVHQVILFFC